MLDRLISTIERLGLNDAPYEVVGYGLSFALSMSIASYLRARGYFAFATLPDHRPCVPNAVRILVSESAREPLWPANILVTHATAKPHWTSPPSGGIISVKSAPSGAWFPLKFASSVLGAKWRATERPLAINPDEELTLIFDSCGPDAREYIIAASNKVDGINLRALSIVEFGHGYHRSLLKKSKSNPVIFCLPKGAYSKRWGDIRAWITSHATDPSINQIDLPGAEQSADYALSVGITVIDFIGELCRLRGIDLSNCPIPRHLDNLR